MMMKTIRCSVLCAFLIGVLGVGSALAQTTGGTIRGTITDPQGLAVAEATVSITNTQTNVTIKLSSSSDGLYNYPDLTVGTYTVTVEKEGFRKLVRSGIQIYANQVTAVDIALTVGALTSTVEVTAAAPLVQTATAQISNDFGTLQLTQIPNAELNGSPLSLAMLAPGTTGQGAGILGEGGSIGGTRPRMNSFTIDGVDDNRLDVNGHSQDVIQDSIAEFNLLTNQFSAEYGHSAGGQFNIITKTGTNTWHGDGWIYNQNRHYNAMDNLEKASGQTLPNRFDYNRFGAGIGGPILKDKLFIYGAYQRIVEGLAAQAVTQSAPTAAGLATLQSISNSAVQEILSQFPTAPTEDTLEPVTVAGTACDEGCNIPFGPISPKAPSFYNIHDFIINGDLNYEKHQIAVHVLYDRNRSPNVNPDTPQAQFSGSIAVDARKYLAKDTWTVTNSFVNEFRTSYSRFSLAYTVPSTFANFPNVEIDGTGLNIGPEGNSPQSNVINTYQFEDNMNYVRGKHSFKWGVEWMHWIAPSSFLPRARGEWDYADLNQFVNDYAPGGTNGALRNAGSGGFAGNQNGVYWFVQDDWKITPRLTLNLGLRYEWNGVPRDDALQNVNGISNLPGVFLFRKPPSDRNNWAPRLGFAYDPLGDGKWAVRGGFGISYDVTPQNFPSISLPPQLQTEQNPDLTCGASSAPAWCENYSHSDYVAGNNTGQGFLAGGGLLQVNVPCATQAECRASTGSFIVPIVEPKVLTWTLGVQHEVGWNSSLEARYMGTRSLELPIQARLNTQTGFSAGLSALPTYLSAADVPATVTSPAATLATWDQFESNADTCPTLGPSPFIYGADGFCGGALVTGFPPLGSGIYHAVSLDFNHRVGHGLTLRANYTFAKNIDNSTNELFSSRVQPRRPQDWQNVADDRGLSALDVPHKLAVSWVYELPEYHADSAFARGFTSGWQLSGSWLVSSGVPVTILNGGDANGNFDSAGDRPIFNSSGTVNAATDVDFVCNDGIGGATSIVSDPADCGSGDDSNIVGYVAQDPTARYVIAQLGARSTVGRNSFRSPGLQVWSMSLGKTTKINERVGVQFRLDMYNIFNHRNFALAQPSVFQPLVNNALSSTYSDPTSSLFGDQTTFSGGARNMQLTLKLSF
jgi:hypothetical protein